MAAGDRPLEGVRVLDLSRVIAGPVAGRTLAVHGADVLLISGPDLPAIPWLTIDTGRGKLTSFAELKSEQGRGVLRGLLASADIFSQGYRPRALASLGFSPQDAARISPGIVYVSLSAYGHAGPWAERRVSIRWCRPRPVSTTPKGWPPASMGQRNCRRKCSITPPAI
jgi:Predicted acyl-CoA transferases/carnitine dehydratase